jgi:hypothetical protein
MKEFVALYQTAVFDPVIELLRLLRCKLDGQTPGNEAAILAFAVSQVGLYQLNGTH